MPLAWWTLIFGWNLVVRGSSLSEEVMRSLGLFIIYGLPICLVVMFTIGYPLALLLKSLGKLTAPHLCAGAFLMGFLVMAVAYLMSPSGIFQAELAFMAGGTGIFAAIVFCLVAGIPVRRISP